MTPAAVQVLDIRGGGPDLSFLDSLDRAGAHRLGLPGRVVVVDATDCLLANHDRYQRLVSLPHVRAVICVAVGPLHHDDEVSLRQSAAFRSAGVTLWVGDERGSRWAGGTSRPLPVLDGPEVLPDLVCALGSVEIFDEVHAAVQQVPYQTACPGLNVVRAALDRESLRAMHRVVLADLADRSAAELPAPAAPAPPRAGAQADPALDVVVPGSPLGKNRQALRQAVDTTADAAAAVARTAGLLRGGPPVEPARVRAAFDGRLDRIDDLLVLMDRQAAGHGGEELTRLGVPAGDPPDHPRLAGQLRELVRAELSRGRSLRDLSATLRAVANRSMAPDVEKFRAELRSLRRHLTPEAIRLPASAWLGPAAVTAVLAGLCAGVVTWLASWPAGAGVALAGTLLVALFAVRYPGRSPGPGTLLPAVAAAALVAAAGAYAGTLPPPADTGPPGAVPAVVGAVAVLAAGVSLAWRRATAKWLAALRIPETREAVQRAESLVAAKITEHVRGMAHARRLTDAALALASDTGALADLYRLRAGPESGQRIEVLPDLVTVLREDLITLVMRALDDQFATIGTDVALSPTPAELTADAERELGAYEQFLDDHGIYRKPGPAGDGGARDRLNLAFWQRSEAARRALRTDGRGEFVQLCRIGDIRALDVGWRGTRVLRFAPEAAQRALVGAGDEPVLTADLELAGALRLVPLAAGRVVHQHPAATGRDEEDGSPT
ncbi:hypothetical protein [Amycolatopsis vancoresmycina]|nr:hypothetical protein [Amycolatopsis vancoresmycina]